MQVNTIKVSKDELNVILSEYAYLYCTVALEGQRDVCEALEVFFKTSPQQKLLYFITDGYWTSQIVIENYNPEKRVVTFRKA